MEHKYSYLVVYSAQTEEGQCIGDINIRTSLKLSYNDLKETKQMLAERIKSDAKNIIITNIIPLRFEK